jgi:hypothetical protein
LLLVDYIFDWARDIYRDNIIHSLRSLASGENDAASIWYPDTDLFSTQEVDQTERPTATSEPTGEREYNAAKEAFKACDSNLHAVRHASFIETRFRCIVVTGDDVRTMLHLTERHMTHVLCRLVLDEMRNGIVLDYSTIEALEACWTSTVRQTSAVIRPDTDFHTLIACSYSISPDWHLVRELDIFAVAEDAWDGFVEFSRLKTKSPKEKPSRVNVGDGDLVLGLIRRRRSDSTEETLVNCLKRSSMRFARRSKKHAQESGELDGFVVLNGSSVYAISRYTHSSFRQEENMSQATFLRTSRIFGQQQNDPEECNPPDFTVKVDRPPLPLILSEGGSILVHASSSTRDRGRSRRDICLYIVNGPTTPPTWQEASHHIKQTLMTRDIYSTTRDNGPVNVNYRTLAPWNLTDVYGICFEPKKFLRLLRSLDGSDLPRRQGSPASPTTSNPGLTYSSVISLLGKTRRSFIADGHLLA